MSVVAAAHRADPPCSRSWRAAAALVGLLSCSLAGNLNANIVTVAYPALMQVHQVSFDLAGLIVTLTSSLAPAFLLLGLVAVGGAAA